jgi:hypothetical protein
VKWKKRKREKKMIKEEADINYNELLTNNYNVNNQLHYFVY